MDKRAYSIRVPTKILNNIRKEAEKQCRTVSSLIIWILTCWLKDNK